MKRSRTLNEAGTSQSSRRQFIRTGSSLAATATVVASAAYPVHAAGDDTLKVGWIGCGNRGTGAVIQALQTQGNVKLWSMADAWKENLDRALDNIKRGVKASYDRDQAPSLEKQIDVPAERQFTGLDAFQHVIDSGIDVVIITGPPGFRPQHFEYAINAGIHVFMEKPVATDAHGVRRVLATAQMAKQKNLKVGVGLQRHHQPSYLEAIDRIRDGQLGDVMSLKCYWNTSAPAKTPFPREQMTELEYQVKNWYFFDWLSGDHICEQHIHNLDVCNWVMQGPPVQAQGMGGRQVRTGKDYGNIFDHHAVQFTYADGTEMFSQCRQIPGCLNEVAEHVLGTKGRGALNANQCKFLSGQETLWQSERNRPAAPIASPYQLEQDDFFAAIRNDLPFNEAEYGATSTMTAIMGRMATYSGKLVTWDDALAAEKRLTTDALAWSDEAPIQPGKDGFYRVAIPGVTKVL